MEHIALLRRLLWETIAQKKYNYQPHKSRSYRYTSRHTTTKPLFPEVSTWSSFEKTTMQAIPYDYRLWVPSDHLSSDASNLQRAMHHKDDSIVDRAHEPLLFSRSSVMCTRRRGRLSQSVQQVWSSKGASYKYIYGYRLNFRMHVRMHNIKQSEPAWTEWLSLIFKYFTGSTG